MPELLDGDAVDDATRVRALRDVARANVVFGGARPVLAELWSLLRPLPRGATLLDVGTGAGDIAARAIREGRSRDVELEVFGVDLSHALAREANAAGTPSACGDASSLPFGDRSVDVVLCSQLLHHFSDDDAVRVLRELARVAR